MKKGPEESFRVIACPNRVDLPPPIQVHEILLATEKRVRVELSSCDEDRCGDNCKKPALRTGTRKVITKDVENALLARLAADADVEKPRLVAEDLEKAQGASYNYDTRWLIKDFENGRNIHAVLISGRYESANDLRHSLEINGIDLTGVTIEEVRLANTALQAKGFLVKRTRN